MCIIERHSPSYSQQAVLRGDVGDRVTNCRHALHRANDHDGTTALDHVWNGILRNQETSLEVDSHQPVPLFFAGCYGVPIKLTASFAHQYVDGYVLLDHGINGLRNFFADTYIAWKELADMPVLRDRGSTFWPGIAVNVEDS